MPVVLVKPRKLGICKVQTLRDGRSKRSWASVFMASKHREKLEKPTRSEVSKETLIQCPCPPGPLLGNTSSTVGAPSLYLVTSHPNDSFIRIQDSPNP